MTELIFQEYDDAYEKGENSIRNTPERIGVFVESEADVPFWYMLFKKFAPGLNIEIQASVRLESKADKYAFESGNESNQTGQRVVRGKDIVLSLKNTVGRRRLLCVDSDYDYLLPDRNANAVVINTSKYIFQTYAYSIENYKCFVASLDCVCVDASYNAEVKFGFPRFLREYSQIVYELFLYSIYSKKHALKKAITIKKFRELAGLGKPNIDDNATGHLEKLKSDIEKKLKEVDAANPHIDFKKEIKALATELEQKFKIQRENVYWFINGHILFDDVVAPTVKQVIRKLQREKYRQIEGEATESGRANSWRNRYHEMTYDATMLLNVNKGHYHHACSLLDKIKKDIDRYLHDIRNSRQTVLLLE